MDFKNITIEDIIAYCKENNEVEWLKKIAASKVECKVYPRVKTTNKAGKTVSVADKSQPYTVEMRPISFVQIKSAFIDKFYPEQAKKEKKPSMYDIIAAL